MKKLLRRFFTARMLVFVLGLCLFLPYLSHGGLWDPWETHYSEVSRQILERGDWLVLHWGDNDNRCKWRKPGEVFYSKPPLAFWIQALFFLIFGVSDLVARLPFAIAGAYGLSFFFWAVRTVWDTRRAAIATLVLATAPMYAMLARHAMLDIMFAAFLIASMGSFYVWAFGPRGHPRYLYRFYTFAALATMTKGLPGVAIPAAAVLLFTLVTWNWALLARIRPVSGWVWFLLLAAPWHIYMWTLGEDGVEGDRWYNEYIIYHHVTRGEKVFQGAGEGGLEYYVKPLLASFYPWIALIPAALAHLLLGVRRRLAPDAGKDTFVPALMTAIKPGETREAREEPQLRLWGDPLEERRRHAVILSACWIVVWLAVIASSATKFNHYVFPVLPPLALLVGLYLADLKDREITGGERLLLATGLAVFVLFSSTLLDGPGYWAYSITYDYTRAPLDKLGTVALSAPWLQYLVWPIGLALVLLLSGRARRVAYGVLGAGALALAALLIHGFMPAVAPAMSQSDAWSAVEEHRQEGDRVFNYRMTWRGEVWYSRDTVGCVKDQAGLREVLTEPGRILFVTNRDGGKRGRLLREYRSIARRSMKTLNEHPDNYVVLLHDGRAVPRKPVPPPKGVVQDELPGTLTSGIGAHLGDLELAGYRLASLELAPRKTVDLTLYWKVGKPLGTEYQVFLHGEQEGGRCLVRDTTPADGRFPTTAWKAGQVVADRHRFVLPRGCKAGELKLYGGLFNDSGRMRVVEKDKTDGHDRILIDTLEVGSP